MIKEPVSDVEIAAQEKLDSTTFVPSRFRFLGEHNGIRPNSLHGLIANSGVGKSTLFKCIIVETAKVVPVLVWLTEETVKEYQPLMNRLDKSVLDNIKFVEEKEIASEYKDNLEAFFTYFEEMVKRSGCAIVFCDNVTTSAFYDGRFSYRGQNRTATFLVEFVKRVCSFFYVAHTRNEVTDNYRKVVTEEDIRGSKQLALLTEYCYIIQKFTSKGNIYNILRVVKYRFHEKAAGWYTLVYEKGYYVGDAKVPFDMINQIFYDRDYFGKKLAKGKPIEKPTGKGALL